MRPGTDILGHAWSWTARALTLLTLACTVLGAFAGYINPATWALPSALCLVFLPLWLTSGFLEALWFVFSRCLWMKITGAAALVITLPALLTVSPVSFPAKADPGQPTFTVMSYNAHYCEDADTTREPEGYSRTLHTVLASGADIVAMQEMYWNWDEMRPGRRARLQADSIRARYPYIVSDRHVNIILFSRFPVKEVSHTKRNAMNYFAYQQYVLLVEGRELNLVNVHLPSYLLSRGELATMQAMRRVSRSTLTAAADSSAGIYAKLRAAFEVRARAAEDLAAVTRPLPSPLIVCGDFNDVPLSYAWRTLRRAGLEDAYAACATGPTYTYNQHHMLFHIDQMLYRGALRPVAFSVGSVPSSDHYPITATFALQ